MSGLRVFQNIMMSMIAIAMMNRAMNIMKKSMMNAIANGSKTRGRNGRISKNATKMTNRLEVGTKRH